MVRKMVLIPADMAAHYSQQQHVPGVAALTQLSTLDQQMKSILEDNSIPLELKFKQYYNILHRYGALKDNAEKITEPAVAANPQLPQVQLPLPQRPPIQRPPRPIRLPVKRGRTEDDTPSTSAGRTLRSADPGKKPKSQEGHGRRRKRRRVHIKWESL